MPETGEHKSFQERYEEGLIQESEYWESLSDGNPDYRFQGYDGKYPYRMQRFAFVGGVAIIAICAFGLVYGLWLLGAI